MLYHQPNKDLELATLKRSLAAGPNQCSAKTMGKKRKSRKKRRNTASQVLIRVTLLKGKENSL